MHIKPRNRSSSLHTSFFSRLIDRSIHSRSLCLLFCGQLKRNHFQNPFVEILVSRTFGRSVSIGHRFLVYLTIIVLRYFYSSVVVELVGFEYLLKIVYRTQTSLLFSLQWRNRFLTPSRLTIVSSKKTWKYWSIRLIIWSVTTT